MAALLQILPIVLGIVLFPGTAMADRTVAVEQLRGYVSRVLEVLRDPGLKKGSAERSAALGAVMRETFDFDEMARRSLGEYWTERTAAERAGFADLLAGLLERAYLSHIDSYRDARITYAGAPAEGNDTVVRTTIVPGRGAELPVDYHMRRRGERWRIDDVVIDGVSVVGNYRAQFSRIIRSSSYAALVDKIQALDGGSASSARSR